MLFSKGYINTKEQCGKLCSMNHGVMAILVETVFTTSIFKILPIECKEVKSVFHGVCVYRDCTFLLHSLKQSLTEKCSKQEKANESQQEDWLLSNWNASLQTNLGQDPTASDLLSNHGYTDSETNLKIPSILLSALLVRENVWLPKSITLLNTFADQCYNWTSTWTQ